MKVKIVSLYKVENTQVILKRLTSTAYGTPRYEVTVIEDKAYNGAYNFNMLGHHLGEEEEAQEAYRRYVEYINS